LRYLAKITKGIEGMFLRYYPTKALAFNAIVRIAMICFWMCDLAFHHFSRYHPQMTYEKDRMIARGAASCHEVFTWT
jgi:hypothetical protein